MTEQEYIDLRDLQRLDSILEIMSGMDANTSSVLHNLTLHTMKQDLYKWRSDLYQKLTIDHED